MLADELVAYLFDGKPHTLAPPMATWLAASRRFADFVTTYRTKIRKKLRFTQEMERQLDLRLELETAYLLLQERSLSVAYEPLPSKKLHGPDFAVTFTTSVTFMVEVTRMRPVPDYGDDLAYQPDHPNQPQTSLIRLSLEERLIDTVCGKLGQLLPQSRNILLVGANGLPFTADTLRTAMLDLQHRVERNDPIVLQRHNFRDRGDFFHHYHRLSEIVVRRPQLQADESVLGWINPQAKLPLPSKVRTALYRSHIG